MSKHTPGPWMLDINKRGGEWDYLIRTVKPHNPAGGVGMHVATVNVTFKHLPEDNARLIAAAPEMLEALKAVVAVADRKTVEFDAARAAIAKAEGR